MVCRSLELFRVDNVLNCISGDLTVDAGSLSSAERTQRGITQSMPRSLKSALATFFPSAEKSALATMLSAESDEDSNLIQAMGTEVCRKYKRVKEAEMELLKTMEKREEGESEQQAIDRRKAWLMQRY